jgi:hypothetical protein
MMNILQFAKLRWTFCWILAKEKKRLFLTASAIDGFSDNGSESDGAANGLADELLVISLGITNECPGMLPEQKVIFFVHEHVVATDIILLW